MKTELLSVLFTPNDAVDYTTATMTATINVLKAATTTTVVDAGGAWNGTTQFAAISTAKEGHDGYERTGRGWGVTPTELRGIGEKRYGPRWQSKLARALPVNPRTVRSWLSGKRKSRPVIAERIRSLTPGV